MKRIGVLTSGGDAPGMNACIRAVVRTAKYFGMEIYGIRQGYSGLINDDMVPMEMRSVSDIVQRGGTILRTARCVEMYTVEGQKQAVKTLNDRGIEGLVVIGGDGSFRGAKCLSEEYGIPTIGTILRTARCVEMYTVEGQKQAVKTLNDRGIEGLVVIGGDGSFRGAKCLSEEYGIPTIGIPGTIDNDLEYTDYTLGFDTAVNTCLDIINKLRDTMTSHERISVVEVMGRRCGDIALYSGIASGAEIIIVPEIAYDMEDVVLRINRSRANGKHSNIIVLAEGVANAEEFSKKLQEMTTYSVRGTTIGHVQRGGSPSMADRMLAAQFGNRAVRMLKEGIGNRVVGIHRNEIVDLDIIEAVSMKKKFNYELYETLQMISM